MSVVALYPMTAEKRAAAELVEPAVHVPPGGASSKGTSEPAVLAFLQSTVERHSGETAFCVWERTFWRSMSYGEIRHRAELLSSYLVERGFERGARVAILCDSKPEWGVAFFTAVRAGGIALPLDAALSVGELANIVQDARPALLLASAGYLDKARELARRTPLTHEVIVLEDESVAGEYRCYRELQPAAGVVDVEERRWDEVAVLTYTSGTTGRPKGVMTTFHSLAFEVTTLHEVMNADEGETLVSILPLNHLLELTCGFLTALFAGSSICYVGSLFPEDVLRAMKEKRATRMVAVPLFFRMVKRSVQRRVASSSAVARLAFALLFHGLALVPSQALRKRLFAKLHRELGMSSLKSFLSGGAPLDDETERFFRRVGLPIYQGYGLTETGPVISTNAPRAHRAGSVGRPLPGLEVRIAHDGEIFTRGPHVMAGYWNANGSEGDEPRDADGWFCTGDLGSLDGDGYLYITGRKKNLIVLGSGKKVQPEEIELVFEGQPAFAEVCVVGVQARGALQEGHEEVACAVVPSDAWRARYSDEAELRQVIEDEVGRVAAGIAAFKRPTFVLVTLRPLPRTATRKLKRPVVHALIEEHRKGGEP